MGMVASEEYVRTSRQVVFTIQRAVNRSIVTGLITSILRMRPLSAFAKLQRMLGRIPTGSGRDML